MKIELNLFGRMLELSFRSKPKPKPSLPFLHKIWQDPETRNIFALTNSRCVGFSIPVFDGRKMLKFILMPESSANLFNSKQTMCKLASIEDVPEDEYYQWSKGIAK